MIYSSYKLNKQGIIIFLLSLWFWLFQIFHLSGTMKCVFFCIWLISLKAKFLRFTNVAYIRSSFLFMAEKHCIVCIYIYVYGLPWWLRWESICLQCGRPRFNPWVGKISWKRKWQPTPIFFPRKSHGWRNLVGYSPWCHRVGYHWATSLSLSYIYNIYMPHIVYASVCWWILGLFLHVSYYE